MKKIKVRVSERKKLPTWPVGYGRSLTVMVPYPENPREGICEACERRIDKKEINVTALHHWIYRYKHNTIKKDPLKALENNSEVCFFCHKLADALRVLFTVREENLWKVIRVAKLMPESMKKKFDWVVRAWLDMRKVDKEKVLNDYF